MKIPQPQELRGAFLQHASMINIMKLTSSL